MPRSAPSWTTRNCRVCNRASSGEGPFTATSSTLGPRIKKLEC